MPDRPPMGAHVEIVEPLSAVGGNPDGVPCIKPYRVRINGTDVGLISGDFGIQIDIGDGKRPASITLKLFPKSIEIKAD